MVAALAWLARAGAFAGAAFAGAAFAGAAFAGAALVVLGFARPRALGAGVVADLPRAALPDADLLAGERAVVRAVLDFGCAWASE